jgi:hypothetical protein
MCYLATIVLAWYSGPTLLEAIEQTGDLPCGRQLEEKIFEPCSVSVLVPGKDGIFSPTHPPTRTNNCQLRCSPLHYVRPLGRRLCTSGRGQKGTQSALGRAPTQHAASSGHRHRDCGQRIAGEVNSLFLQSLFLRAWLRSHCSLSRGRVDYTGLARFLGTSC